MNGRCNGDQVPRRPLLRQPQRTLGAERESGNDQAPAGPARSAPRGNGVRIGGLPHALVETPTLAPTPRSEAHRRMPVSCSARATVVTTLLSMVPPN